MNDYEKFWGPQWRVTSVKDPGGNVLTDIDFDHGMTFEGDGNGGGTCNLYSHDKKAYVAKQCKGTLNSGELVHIGSNRKYLISRTNRVGTTVPKMTLTEHPSGGTGWTMEEGG